MWRLQGRLPKTVISVELEVMDLEYLMSESFKAGTDLVTFYADAANPLSELVEAIRKVDFIFGLVLKLLQTNELSPPEVDVDVIVIKMELPEFVRT